MGPPEILNNLGRSPDPDGDGMSRGEKMIQLVQILMCSFVCAWVGEVEKKLDMTYFTDPTLSAVVFAFSNTRGLRLLTPQPIRWLCCEFCHERR